MSYMFWFENNLPILLTSLSTSSGNCSSQSGTKSVQYLSATLGSGIIRSCCIVPCEKKKNNVEHNYNIC